jgi:histone-lysine N-methyltransferase SETD3
MEPITGKLNFVDEKESAQKIPEQHILYTELFRWVRDSGGFFPNLYFETYSENFRGLHTTRDTPANEIIMEIPTSCLLTPLLAKTSPIGQAMAQAGFIPRNLHTYLTAFILEEKCSACSNWQPYLNVLPTNFNNMPVLWPPEDLKLLAGSLAVPLIEERRQKFLADYRDLCLLVENFARHSIEQFFWAQLAVQTRIFSVTVDGKRIAAMVPVADMLNHKRPSQTFWTFDDSRGCFTVTSKQVHKAGDAVLDSYGKKCNTRYLLDYGFISDYNDDQDTARFRVQLDEKDPMIAAKMQLLNGKATRELHTTRDYESPACLELFSYLRIKHATAKEWDLIMQTRGSHRRVPSRGTPTPNKD